MSRVDTRVRVEVVGSTEGPQGGKFVRKRLVFVPSVNSFVERTVIPDFYSHDGNSLEYQNVTSNGGAGRKTKRKDSFKPVRVIQGVSKWCRDDFTLYTPVATISKWNTGFLIDIRKDPVLSFEEQGYILSESPGVPYGSRFN